MKNLTLSLITVASLFFFSACDLTDVLNQEPPNNLTPDNVVEDAEGAEDLLRGVYASLHDQYYYMYSETNPGLMSGSMTTGGFLADAEFASNSLSIDNGNVASTWQVYYKTMDAANVLIDIVGEMDESEFSGNRQQEMIAEARYMRAMALFDALRYFGQFWDTGSELGVIFRTVPVDFTTRDIARSTVQESYDQIIADLDFAMANAPDFTVPYRASKIAAKALKSKVLLFLEQYDDAAQLADEVVSDDARELEGTFSEVFSTGFNSSEMLFMRYTDEVTATELNERKRFTYGSGHAIAGDWLKTLMSGDPREASTYNTEEDEILKVNNETHFRPTYFQRLAEVYLIQAEALARSSSSTLEEAKAPFEEVRSRALGTPYDSPATNKEELLEEIFDEIALELAFENGSEWFAAIRFGEISNLKPEVTSSDQYILPIPQRELEGNRELSQQNPGYTQ